jgi:hypothetical protein
MKCIFNFVLKMLHKLIKFKVVDLLFIDSNFILLVYPLEKSKIINIFF